MMIRIANSPFHVQGRLHKPLVVLFLLVNGLVALNAALHNPLVGYDMSEHNEYVQKLANGKLPTADQSDEFFSPPLPYVFPALLLANAHISPWRAAKDAQWFNVLLSIGLTFTMLKICARIQPHPVGFRIAALALLGMLPVYYKTFSQPRAEPFVAFFAVLAADQTLALFAPENHWGRSLPWRRILSLGIILGLATLSRQWSFLLFPALVLFVGLLVIKQKRLALIWPLLVSFSVAFAVSGWFYIYLFRTYGSFTAFNRQPQPFSIRNQPASFYFDLRLDKLFSDPVRPSFPNRLWPILYADTWGDYWCYFLITNEDTRSQQRGDPILYLVGKPLEDAITANPVPEWLKTNHFEISGYLGRVNLLALLPSALFVAGALLGMVHWARLFYQRFPAEQTVAFALLALLVAISFLGYAWFLIRYPILDQGDNIKATYIIQIYPFLAILAGNALQKIASRWPSGGWAVGAMLALIFCHNLPAMLTRFQVWSTHLTTLMR